MGSKKQRNRNYVGQGLNTPPVVVPGFEKIDQLANAIEAPFLKSRTHAYVDSARELADALDSLKVPEIDVETFRQGLSYEFAAYAKNTRLIDFILSVSGSSRYQSESGRQIARAICQAVEMRLAPAVTKQEDGTICIVHPDTSGPILVDTAYSKSGRWIARLFARVVPQSQGS